MGFNGVRYGQGLSVMPIFGPIDLGNAGTDNTQYVDVGDASWCTFLVMLGAMTSDASDTVTFLVDASTDGSTTGEAIAYKYRLSSAVATNTWGAITAGSSDGSAIVGATDDNKGILIDVDPAVVAAAKEGARWVRLDITNVGPIALISVAAFLEHRFLGNTMSSS